MISGVGEEKEGKVYAWHADGSMVKGWPQATGGAMNSTPAVADLDGDGRLEVVVGSGDSKVYAWHADGSVVAGWPHGTGGIVTSSPAIANIDGDQRLEVVIGSRDGQVYAWHHDGSLVTGWPQATGGVVNAAVAIADLGGDGTLEVIVSSSDAKVYAWHATGTVMVGWPQDAGGKVGSSPAIADLDGDGMLEILVGADDGRLHAWHADGTLVAGWPQRLATQFVDSSPVIADVNGDGTLEVVIGSGPGDLYGEGDVYVWSVPWTSSARTPWPKFRHDPQNSGLFNTAPVMRPLRNRRVPVGTLLSFPILATDADGNVMAFTSTNLPPGATLVTAPGKVPPPILNSPRTQTATFHWVPTTEQVGTYTLTFQVSDGVKVRLVRQAFKDLLVTPDHKGLKVPKVQ